MDILSYLLGKHSGGGGGSSLDWSVIGYTSTPQPIIDGYDYAKEIYDNWDAERTNFINYFQGNHNLIYMPMVDVSKGINCYTMFSSCESLTYVPALNFSSATDVHQMFQYCYALKEVGNINISNATIAYGLFSDCHALKEIPPINTSKVTAMGSLCFHCYELTTVPVLDASGIVSGGNAMQNMFSDCGNLTNQSLDNILQMCIGATNYTGTKTLYQLGFRKNVHSASKIQGLPHYQDFIDAGWTIGY